MDHPFFSIAPHVPGGDTDSFTEHQNPNEWVETSNPVEIEYASSLVPDVVLPDSGRSFKFDTNLKTNLFYLQKAPLHFWSDRN